MYVISFSFLELCFLFLLLRRNHGLMPERKGKKIKHFFVGLYKKLMAFLGDNILAGASTRSLKSASHSSPFQFLHKPIQLKGQIISEQNFFTAFDCESLFSLVCGVALIFKYVLLTYFACF